MKYHDLVAVLLNVLVSLAAARPQRVDNAGGNFHKVAIAATANPAFAEGYGRPLAASIVSNSLHAAVPLALANRFPSESPGDTLESESTSDHGPSAQTDAGLPDDDSRLNDTSDISSLHTDFNFGQTSLGSPMTSNAISHGSVPLSGSSFDWASAFASQWTNPSELDSTRTFSSTSSHPTESNNEAPSSSGSVRPSQPNDAIPVGPGPLNSSGSVLPATNSAAIPGSGAVGSGSIRGAETAVNTPIPSIIPVGFPNFNGGSALTPNNGAVVTPTPAVDFTTLVITVSSPITITSCPPTITICPASKSTSYVTTTTYLYTTICPVTEAPQITSSLSASPPSLPGFSPQTSNPAMTPSSYNSILTPAPIQSDILTPTLSIGGILTPIPTPIADLTTLVITDSFLVTITSCAPTVTVCSGSQSTTYITTSTHVYTTICPVADILSITSSLGHISPPLPLPLSTPWPLNSTFKTPPPSIQLPSPFFAQHATPELSVTLTTSAPQISTNGEGIGNTIPSPSVMISVGSSSSMRYVSLSIPVSRCSREDGCGTGLPSGIPIFEPVPTPSCAVNDGCIPETVPVANEATPTPSCNEDEDDCIPHVTFPVIEGNSVPGPLPTFSSVPHCYGNYCPSSAAPPEDHHTIGVVAETSLGSIWSAVNPQGPLESIRPAECGFECIPGFGFNEPASAIPTEQTPKVERPENNTPEGELSEQETLEHGSPHVTIKSEALKEGTHERHTSEAESPTVPASERPRPKEEMPTPGGEAPAYVSSAYPSFGSAPRPAPAPAGPPASPIPVPASSLHTSAGSITSPVGVVPVPAGSPAGPVPTGSSPVGVGKAPHNNTPSVPTSTPQSYRGIAEKTSVGGLLVPILFGWTFIALFGK